jgi:hypothetical protein
LKKKRKNKDQFDNLDLRSNLRGFGKGRIGSGESKEREDPDEYPRFRFPTKTVDMVIGKDVKVA